MVHWLVHLLLHSLSKCVVICVPGVLQHHPIHYKPFGTFQVWLFSSQILFLSSSSPVPQLKNQDFWIYDCRLYKHRIGSAWLKTPGGVWCNSVVIFIPMSCITSQNRKLFPDGVHVEYGLCLVIDTCWSYLLVTWMIN